MATKRQIALALAVLVTIAVMPFKPLAYWAGSVLWAGMILFGVDILVRKHKEREQRNLDLAIQAGWVSQDSLRQDYPPKAHEVHYLSDEHVLAKHSKLADYLRMKVADNVSNRADVQMRVVSDFHPIRSAYYGQAGSLHITDVAYVENYQSLSRYPVLEGGPQPSLLRPPIPDAELITINTEVEQIPQLIGLIKFMLDAKIDTFRNRDTNAIWTEATKPCFVENIVEYSMFGHGENVDNAWFDLVHGVKIDLSPYHSHPDYISLVEHLEANATILSAMGDGSAKIMIEAWLNPEKDIQAHELPELDVTF